MQTQMRWTLQAEVCASSHLREILRMLGNGNQLHDPSIANTLVFCQNISIYDLCKEYTLVILVVSPRFRVLRYLLEATRVKNMKT